MYPLVGGQIYYEWMNISQTLLIRKWGAETPTPTTVRRGPSHHGRSTETAWRAQTLPPPSRNRAGISIESRRWKSRRAGSPALTGGTKGQNQHRSKSKLRPEERMGNYLCSAEANRRFLRMTSRPGTLKITLTDLPTERKKSKFIQRKP